MLYYAKVCYAECWTFCVNQQGYAGLVELFGKSLKKQKK